MHNYVDEFPIPDAILPPRLRGLLEPVGVDPALRVDVTTRFDFDHYGPKREYVHMLMAVVPGLQPGLLRRIRETGDGVVYSSRPDVDNEGGIRDFVPSVSGFDYIVASNGSGSFFGFSLAEKVWIALGLTPRAIGGDQQRLAYDDLEAPEFGIAEGEISNEYYFTSKRDVSWTMSNQHLRQYLWMRGAHGVRAFFYEKLFDDCAELRALMGGQSHVFLEPKDGWYQLDIRVFNGRLLVQVWAVVYAVEPSRCVVPTADGLLWPEVNGPMTHVRANALRDLALVFVRDQFLERYEQSALFDTSPVDVHGQWHCSPSYLGQWSFTNCVRVGRNLVSIPMRDLYKALPDREIVHAHSYVVAPSAAAQLDSREEHVAAKTARLVSQLLKLGDNLAAVGQFVGAPKTAEEIVGFSRSDIKANHWHNYPELARLAQVAPLEMTEQAFLARCKSLHELWQRIPNAFLRTLVEKAGHKRAEVKDLGSLRLLQALTNIVERLNRDGEQIDAFAAGADPDDLSKRNDSLAPLFINNDLRIADAHNAGQALVSLDAIGFDTALTNQGFGRAMDCVFDRVIEAFSHVNDEIGALLTR